MLRAKPRAKVKLIRAFVVLWCFVYAFLVLCLFGLLDMRCSCMLCFVLLCSFVGIGHTDVRSRETKQVAITERNTSERQVEVCHCVGNVSAKCVDETCL